MVGIPNIHTWNVKYPKTYLTKKTYPKEWEELMKKIKINLNEGKNISKYRLPRIKNFIDIMKKQKNKKKMVNKFNKRNGIFIHYLILLSGIHPTIYYLI